MQLKPFRAQLKEYLHQAGYTQKQLAHALGWHPTLLSNKLNEHNFAHLTHAEARQIILILAQWRAIQTREQALVLLADIGMGSQSFSAAEWNTPPLKDLSNTDPAPRAMPAETPQKHSPTIQKNRSDTPFPVITVYGRDAEIVWLEEQVCRRHARLVALIGLGGIGKTALVTAFAQTVKNRFDFIFIYSLHNAPPLETVLSAFLQSVLDPEQIHRLPPVGDRRQLIDRTIESLQQARCLFILDNFETVLAGGEQSGTYLTGYAEYGVLLDSVGQQPHQSCMILTSREKPSEFGVLETRYSATVMSLALHGLNVAAGRALLMGTGANAPAIYGSDQHWQDLITYYSGNPLALKLLVEPLSMLFGGSIAAFLEEKWGVFSDLQTLLAQQMGRLSAQEQDVLYRFAVERQALSLEKLKADFPWAISSKTLADALLVLQRRGLLEETESVGYFGLQPVILEYLTERLVERVIDEMKQGKTDGCLDNYALLKAETQDYIRESQRNLIALPILNRLKREVKSREQVIELIWRLVAHLRMQPLEDYCYAGGNLLNFLVELKVDLTGADFARMRIWQADLRGVALERVDFSGSDLRGSYFMHAFHAVETVAFSPDGHTLASGGLEGTIRLWEVTTGQCISTFEGHRARVWSVAFSPDGRMLASGSADETVRLWDVASGECRLTLPGQCLEVKSVAFSPDGSRIAWSGTAVLAIWAVDGEQEPRLCTGQTDEIWSVAFSPDGQLLASGSADRTIRLWDVTTGECHAVLTDASEWVWSVAFSPDGTLLASGSSDQKIRLWNIAKEQCQSILTGHTNRVYSVAFSPNGTLLASGSSDQTVRMWEVASGRCRGIFQGHQNLVKSLAFSPDGTLLASASPDQSVRLWDSESGVCVRKYAGYSDRINSVSYHPCGQLIASGSDDNTIRIWDVSTGQAITTLRGHRSFVKHVTFSRDGKRLASGSADHSVRVWDVECGQCMAVLYGFPSWVWCVSFNRDGTLVAGCGNDETIYVWDVATEQCLTTLRGHINFLKGAMFSPDGKIIASGGRDRAIRLWDCTSNVCLRILEGHSGPIWGVAFSPDGLCLASASEDQTVRLWDIPSGECRAVLRGHTQWVCDVAFSPDGQWLASGGDDKRVCIWNAKDGCYLFDLPEHTGGIRTLAFAPGGTEVVVGDNNWLRVWDVHSRKVVRALKNPGLYEGMNIFGVRGLSPVQEANLISLGAVRYGG